MTNHDVMPMVRREHVGGWASRLVWLLLGNSQGIEYQWPNPTPTRSASEGRRGVPRLRFGLVCYFLRVALLTSLLWAEEIRAAPRVEQRSGGLAIANDHVRVLVEDGALRSVEDVRTGEELLHWNAEDPVWYVEFGTRRVLPSPRGEVTVSRHAGRVEVRVKTSIPPPGDVEAVYTMTLGSDPWVEMSIEVHNRSSQEIELVGFPANGLLAKGQGRYLVYPYQSGVILPLDERFGQMRIYGSLPFVLGYPSNVCSMQWLGAYGPRGGLMLMNTDRYGALKRMGDHPGGDVAARVGDVRRNPSGSILGRRPLGR